MRQNQPKAKSPVQRANVAAAAGFAAAAAAWRWVGSVDPPPAGAAASQYRGYCTDLEAFDPC